MLILLGMFHNRSSKGKEGISSPSMRAWLNAADGSGFGSNGMWMKGLSAEGVVSGGTSIWFCWIDALGRLLRIFVVSSSGGIEEGVNLFVASSGVLSDTNEESVIISKEPGGLDTESVCPSFELGCSGREKDVVMRIE